jgi:IstB-like ATP binding protein
MRGGHHADCKDVSGSHRSGWQSGPCGREGSAGACAVVIGECDPERFGMLVDVQWLHREDNRLSTALREAKLKLSSECLEDIEYSPKCELDREQLRQRAAGRWVAEHHNILITGMTGTGKTYLAQRLSSDLSKSIMALLRIRRAPSDEIFWRSSKDRYGTRSTPASFRAKRWHEHIADPTHADGSGIDSSTTPLRPRSPSGDSAIAMRWFR